MTKKEINTKASEFKIIKDSKDEPNLKEAQEFVGGYVQGITFPNGDYLIMRRRENVVNFLDEIKQDYEVIINPDLTFN